VRIDSLLRVERFSCLCGVLTILGIDLVYGEDPAWFRAITLQGSRPLYYQPLVDDWRKFNPSRQTHTITIQPGGKAHPGVVAVRMEIALEMDPHTVQLTNTDNWTSW